MEARWPLVGMLLLLTLPGCEITGTREAYYEVPVLYGTDRAMSQSADPRQVYGTVRGTGAVHYGAATVSIPRSHAQGELEEPRWYKLESSEDPVNHVALLGAQPLSQDEWVDRMKRQLSTALERSQLIYIHGYNTGFADAARRTAQLSWDLAFNGVPVLFSWASADDPLAYAVDEATIEWSTPHLKEFLDVAIRQSGVEKTFVIVHSMGSRALGRALSELMDSDPAVRARIADIVFAAPDIDADVFKTQILPRLSPAARVTLYASSDDEAIRTSHSVHGYNRAGSGLPYLLVAPPMVTIDASDVGSGLLGHSYYAEDLPVLADIRAVMQGKPPEQRGALIHPATLPGGAVYYRFLPSN